MTVFAIVLLVLGFAQAEPPSEYVIGPEDVLDIVVWNNTTISRTVPVRPDGKISLPLLNDVQAAGLTPTALRAALSDALTSYMPVPNVSVIVREVHSFKVSVIGAVKTPGRYELKSETTVLEVLAMAGGLGEFADRGRIVVLRQQNGVTKRIPFAYEKVTNGDAKKTVEENFCVRPGDVVFVP